MMMSSVRREYCRDSPPLTIRSMSMTIQARGRVRCAANGVSMNNLRVANAIEKPVSMALHSRYSGAGNFARFHPAASSTPSVSTGAHGLPMARETAVSARGDHFPKRGPCWAFSRTVKRAPFSISTLRS